MVLAYVTVLAPVIILAVSPYYGVILSYADNLCHGASLYYGVTPCYGVILSPSLWC